MNNNDQISVQNLFIEKSFSNAIENKDIEEVTNNIRKACYNCHIKSYFDTPEYEIFKVSDPEQFENDKKWVTEKFEKDSQRLAEIIIESRFVPSSKNDSDIVQLISAINDEPHEVANLYSMIGGTMGTKHLYDHSKFNGLNKDEVEFFKLARKGDAGTMCELITNGVNPHAKTEDKTTALMVAVEYGHRDVAEMLLKLEADIHAREMVDAESAGAGVTAMNLAAHNKDCRMIELLMEYGADINEKAGFDGESPFLIAVCSGDYDYMDFVIGKGVNINIELYNGKTGLIHAVLTDDKKLINYLLDNGADINHRNITGLTALEVAKDYVHTEMVDFLIEAGALDEDRMLEYLVTYRQDLCVWENDIAYAYYHWSTDDGFSHFLIYGIGYHNKLLALSELRRFYIRKKGDECIETYAGDDHHWFHYTHNENSKVVDERCYCVGLKLGHWDELVATPVKAVGAPNADYLFEPAQREEFDFEGRFRKLSEFFLQYVSIVKENVQSEVPSVNSSFTFTRYSEKGWKFLGPYCERASVNVKDEHERVITGLLTDYFIN